MESRARPGLRWVDCGTVGFGHAPRSRALARRSIRSGDGDPRVTGFCRNGCGAGAASAALGTRVGVFSPGGAVLYFEVPLRCDVPTPLAEKWCPLRTPAFGK